MRRIFIPEFRSVEEAIGYAAVHKPFKAALADFQHRDDYGQYGDKAKSAAMLCWEAATKKDESAMWTHMRALSRALPANLFGYVGEKR